MPYDLRRRDLIALLPGAASAALLPPAATAAVNRKIYRVGYLSLGSPTAEAARFDALRGGLRTLGYAEGQDYVMETRWLDGDNYKRLDALAAQLVALKVDVIVTYSTGGVAAAKRMTSTTPIVFASAGDAVASGLVANLSHPGGNVTGNTYFTSELAAGRLDLLAQAMPGLAKAGIIFNPANPTSEPVLAALKAAASALDLELSELPVRTQNDVRDAFAAMTGKRVRAFVMTEDPLLLYNTKACADLALAHRLAASGFPEFADAGGLVAYGIDFIDMWRHAATFVDRILKGAKPADLPVEPATKFVTIVNRKTAAAIGADLPATLLQRASRVIE